MPLAITYGLAWKATTPQVGPHNSDNTVIMSKHNQAELAQQHAAEVHQRAADMHQLLASSGIALLITAVLSIALGWLVAGRVLRPLRTMTAATQRISEQNLRERLAVAWPRTTSSSGSVTPSMTCWPASRRLSTRSAASSPTPPTSCAPH